jgi:hypothetical protein
MRDKEETAADARTGEIGAVETSTVNEDVGVEEGSIDSAATPSISNAPLSIPIVKRKEHKK